MDLNDTPATPTVEALFMAEERALIATLMGGTGSMRAAGKKYLPKAPAESEAAYEYRKGVSTLYNGIRRTIETMAGKPFAEPIALGETVPPQIVDWCEDVDLQGRDLHAFAHAVFVSALADGISHILVEYPKTEPGATLAQKQLTGARPYFLHIKQDQILGTKSERINGVETLVELRFMEVVSVPSGNWLIKKIEQVRVLRPDYWETYRKNEKGEWEQFEFGPVTLGAVPLATVYADRVAFMQARPPLLDLAYLNVEHWQSSSDQSNILHIARVPILFAPGFSEDELKVGTASAITNDDPASKLMYVEHSGAAIEAGRVSIKDLEERMSLMGAQLLVRKPGVATATEKAIDSAEADSALSLMVRNLEDSLEYALQFMSDWEGLGPAGEVELTGEIGGLDDMELAGLMKARELGLLSAETVFNEMQRRGLISDDMEWADEFARLKAEGIPVAVGGSFEAPGFNAANPATPAAQAATNVAPAQQQTAALLTTPHAQQAPDFGPLIESISSLVAQMAKPEPAEPAETPLDLSPLVDAIRAQPAPVINIAPAAITVNVPEQPAPQVNFAQGAITIDSPAVNVTPAPITIEGATINVQPAQVIQPKSSKVEFTLDENGNPTGATLN
jgi:hypothetical protein